MKVTIDIDCTPDEARRFLGLPDIAPLQEAMVEEMRERMMEAARQMDPENMMKMWMPAGVQGMEQMQKMFWSQMGMGMPGDKNGK